ncbi:hypothetical protein AG1IA_03842 [Rhizoctonia solani AG-1 IA]|uniref:Uncharacterized protein n=1 Tax=Thanatephorus cucumeris (strain AG1-IA) TaxID=983506 RepID=L8WVW8_THACA|nr:hypothetical protein AG1IA_03842 [Rhizoctonia solani AG-1 IA]
MFWLGTKRLVIIPRGKKSSGRTSEPTLRTGSRTPEPLKTPEPPVEPTLPARARTKSAGDLVSAWISDGSDARAEKAPVRHIIEKAGEEKGSRRSIGEESVLAYGFPKVPTGVPAVVREEREREREIEVVQIPTPKPSEEVRQIPPLQLKIDGTPSEAPPRKPLCMRWATVEQLIDKLFFCGVSEDGESWTIFCFIWIPRPPISAGAGMPTPCGTMLLPPSLCVFQHLTMTLTNLCAQNPDYPNDFASPGAPSALAAVVRTACENTHLMYYGSEFTYFLEELPCLKDDAFSWAYISAETPVEDEYEFDLDFDREFNFSPEADGFPLFDPSYSIAPGSAVGNADHDEEPPMTGRTARFESGNGESIGRGLSPDARRGASPALKAFQSVAKALLEYNCQSIAEEITRLETELFLKIKVGVVLIYWVRRGVKEDKLGKPKSIVEMNGHVDCCFARPCAGACTLGYSSVRSCSIASCDEQLFFVARVPRRDQLRVRNWGCCPVASRCECMAQVPEPGKAASSQREPFTVPDGSEEYVWSGHSLFMPNTNPEGLVHWAKFTHLANNIHEIHAFQERIRENGDYAFGPVPGLAKLILETELLDMEVSWSGPDELIVGAYWFFYRRYMSGVPRWTETCSTDTLFRWLLLQRAG